MTIDRTALRRLLSSADWTDRVRCLDSLPRLLDELDANDRRIAELEQEYTELQAAVTRLHLDYGARIADLQLRLSIATELNVNDRRRIAELEAGLKEAIDEFIALGVDGPIALRYRLEKLLPSEET